MDQKTLRQFEHRCIQEEPAYCRAACPLHVDVRAFLLHIQNGRWDAARQVLDQTMPFAGILGRICDHPCEMRCKRAEAGGAIAIGALERACVARTASPDKVALLPGREGRIAVFGSGLSSLTAAWDLAKKGYAVTLLEPGEALGGILLQTHRPLLSDQILADETAILKQMGVQVELRAPVSPQCLATACGGYDAIYVGQDGGLPGALGFNLTPEGRIKVAPVTRATEREGVFAGGNPMPDGRRSPVAAAAEGRWAATSIDRYLQKASLTAARPAEGPSETRLFTSLEGVDSRPRTPMSHPDKGYSRPEAEAEAGRCLQCECLACVRVCPYLAHYRGYPKSYARQIYNNLAIVKGERKANSLINSCSLCGLCAAVCPEDFSMADLCLSARREMVAHDKMPPSAHEFALLEMDFSNSGKCALARHAPLESASRHLFFPGCQLCGSVPGHVVRAYAYLRTKLDGGVGLMLGCCGAPTHWSGNSGRFAGTLAQIKQQWQEMGAPRLVLACSSCFSVLGQFMPEADIVSLWDIMADEGLPAAAQDAYVNTPPVSVVDPCTARDRSGEQDSVRNLLQKMGLTVKELPLSRRLTECCGYGGLMANANPGLAKEVIRRRAAQSPLDYVTYCAVCRDHLATAGKRATHLLDWVWPDNVPSDPASRPNPGFSLRRENRARLQENLLRSLWGERKGDMDAWEKIVLHISNELRAILEARRILTEDLRKALYHAQEGGPRFKNPKNGHWLTCHRPLNVTFWVEYQPVDDGIVVYNAYCHRMRVGETDK